MHSVSPTVGESVDMCKSNNLNINRYAHNSIKLLKNSNANNVAICVCLPYVIVFLWIQISKSTVPLNCLIIIWYFMHHSLTIEDMKVRDELSELVRESVGSSVGSAIGASVVALVGSFVGVSVAATLDIFIVIQMFAL